MTALTTSELAMLDESLERLHATGPEFQGWLSNHGPMAVESLVRHGRADAVPRWLDWYEARLEDLPRPYERISDANWLDALGDPRRLGDWPAWFDEQLRLAPWSDVLAQWWPRLLTGVAASATHGVIRVGHAVRALEQAGQSPVRLAELAQALGYWAARWLPIDGRTEPAGVLAVEAALERVPRIGDQSGGVDHRLAQLDGTDGWRGAQAALRPPTTVDDVPDFVRGVVAASVARYATHAHGNPVMLVHASTAPNAILRVLPSLPRRLWLDSAQAAWSAAAAMYAAYAPALAVTPATADHQPAEVLDRVLANGDEHAIKFADTALDVHAWTGTATALTAALRAAALIA
jgi:hypothetical protein